MDKIYDLDAVDVQTSSEEREEEREAARKNALSELVKSIGVIPQDQLKAFSGDLSNTPIVNPEDLLDSLYPNHTKKNKIPRKVLSQLIKKNASSFQMAKCIEPKLVKKSFLQGKPKLMAKIKNAIKSLNKNLKPHGYLIRTKSDIYELENSNSLF